LFCCYVVMMSLVVPRSSIATECGTIDIETHRFACVHAGRQVERQRHLLTWQADRRHRPTRFIVVVRGVVVVGGGGGVGVGVVSHS
jgi:hypothetical protein